MGDYEERRREREERRKQRELEAAKKVDAPQPAPDAGTARSERMAAKSAEATPAPAASADVQSTRARERAAKEDDGEVERKRQEEEAAAAAALKKRDAEEAERRRQKQEEEEEARRQAEAQAEAQAQAEAEAEAEAQAQAEAEAEAQAQAEAEAEAEARRQQQEEEERARQAQAQAAAAAKATPAPAPAAATAVPVDEDSYEARMAARAARRAARSGGEAPAAAPPTSPAPVRSSRIEQPITSPGSVRKSFVPSNTGGLKVSSKEPPKAISDPTVNKAMQKKEMEADDLAAIAERKRLAVQQKEEERKKQLENKPGDLRKSPSSEQFRESTFKKSTSQDQLKDLPAEPEKPVVRKKLDVSFFENAAAKEKPTAVPKKVELRKEDSQGRIVISSSTTPTTSGAKARPSSVFVSPAAPKSSFQMEQEVSQPEPTPPAAAEPSADDVEARKLERERKRASLASALPGARPSGKLNTSMFETPAAAPEEPKRIRPSTVVGAGSFSANKASSFVKAENGESSQPPKETPAPTRGSVFDKSYTAPTREAAPARTVDLPGPKKEITPGGRITVVNTRPAFAAPSTSAFVDAPTISSPLFLFSNVHKDAKEAVIDFINLKLGSDVQLRTMKCVPISQANFASALRDGVLLCKLVNLVSKGTLDERTINMKNLEDKERTLENFQLCINSARSVGCSFTSKNDDLVAGNPKALEEVAWQLVKGALRKRVRVEYEGTGRERCQMCQTKIDSQFGQKGNIYICMDCIDVPLNFINFFTGENAMETNEVKAKTVDAKKKAARATFAY